MDTLIRLESQGQTGPGSGDWGGGTLNGVSMHWRRALRQGNVCGAIVDLTNQQNDPFFFEPSSLALDLAGRGSPEILIRSGEGMVMPGKTQPAAVVWYDPLPPGTPDASETTSAPPVGPYTLKLHPWHFDWRQLAAVAATPAPSLSPSPKPHRR